MRKALAEAGSNCEFRRGVDPLETVGVYASFKTIERVSERVGEEVRKDRHGPFAQIDAPKEAPPNPPELMVLQGDGMRVRLVEDDGGEDAKTAPDGREEGESGGCWHECKVGVVASCIKGYTDTDGEYHDPETLTQTNLATMEDIDHFGDMLVAEAKRRGMDQAGKVVAVSDAGHGLPEMWARLFPWIVWIIDFFHVAGRLAECASEVTLPGAPFKKLLHKWKTLLFDGKTTTLLRILRKHAHGHVDRPGCPADLPEGHTPPPKDRLVIFAGVPPYLIEEPCPKLELAPWGRRWLLLTKGNLADLSGDRAMAVAYYEDVIELKSRWESGRSVTLASGYLETPFSACADAHADTDAVTVASCDCAR